MIDFYQIDEVTIPHMKGGEGYAKARAFVDKDVRIQRSILDPGCSIGLHTHEGSLEVVYVLEGELTCYLNGQKEIARAGEVHYCPQGSAHRMINETDSPVVCLCIVPNIGVMAAKK